jgi:ABC-type polysaccharide/polyol phosphate transport system ATPase subunit
MKRKSRPPKDYLWALRDVSFEIRQGEVVGLIGRNGAGKTTLLKLLSRITRPSTGSAEIVGRIGSLLEVGTGFHPELTGRENIYLSGAILGMKKREIQSKYDAIVAFAEVERFIDTALKHYSTGMQMRLAFAVAAHLEPEILLIDEVLAVGDMEFQKKCLGKMQDISHSGRTIVFVSHQTNQIRRLCQRVFWLQAGGIHRTGNAGEVISAYESSALNRSTDPRDELSVFQGWELFPSGHVLQDGLAPVKLVVMLHLREEIRRGHFGVHLYNDAGVLICSWGFEEVEARVGFHRMQITAQQLPLRPGTYSLVCSLYNGGNNLTGGKLLEIWNGLPFLSVNSLPLGHQQDAWAGVLNIPAELRVI